jgi:hypothetical protein
MFRRQSRQEKQFSPCRVVSWGVVSKWPQFFEQSVRQTGQINQTKGSKRMKLRRNMLGRYLGIAALSLAAGAFAVRASAAETKTIKGEVVDLMCYLDHGAKGEKHAGCARTCIKSGGPVGILTSDDELYLIIGEHKPINDKLAPYAAKIITVKGKVVERDGMKMIENAEIEK